MCMRFNWLVKEQGKRFIFSQVCFFKSYLFGCLEMEMRLPDPASSSRTFTLSDSFDSFPSTESSDPAEFPAAIGYFYYYFYYY